MRDMFPMLIFLAGLGQLTVLVASALVPIRLNWRETFRPLPKLHRQMYWVYGGYIVLAIVAQGLGSMLLSAELAAGSGLARAVCGYVAVFWGVRLAIQGVFDVKEHLTRWWLWAGYYLLSVLFAYFTAVYALAAVWPAQLNPGALCRYIATQLDPQPRLRGVSPCPKPLPPPPRPLHPRRASMKSAKRPGKSGRP
jgi:hypothetical protein